MGKETEISYAHKTFSPWEGCTAVGPGCDNCYAEVRDNHYHGGIHWGAGAARKPMSDGYWKQPPRWNAEAKEKGERYRVLPSLCDPFDNEAPHGERERFWELVELTPYLDWLVLTKRSSNIWKYIPHHWWDDRKEIGVDLPINIWLGVTVENLKHGIPRIEHLRQIPASIRWLSIEPLLEDLGNLDLSGIDWVVCGGESGPHARSMHRRWAESIRFQCIDAGVPYFHKQMSEHDHGKTFRDISTFPSVLQVRQFPGDL